MIKTGQKEVWKIYPKYPFIEASNLGRIRTKDRYVQVKGRGKRLIKGRILKQYSNGDDYVYVAFHTNGKTVHLRVHRIVATCFIPNPHGYPEINHLDNNPKNNSVSNLEWCTHEMNIAYKEKYGVSAKEATKELRKPLFAVNLETSEVLCFKSQGEAARQLGVSQGHISRVIKGELNQIGGYWFTEDKSEITEDKVREIKAKMIFRGGVIAISPETSDVFYFESQDEAAHQLGVNISNINNVIKGKRNRAGGYWFAYADENAVEKAREKFGDEISEKVKELMVENYD